MSGSESYIVLTLLVGCSVLLMFSVYLGRQNYETRSGYYSRLISLLASVTVLLAQIIEEPDWLDEMLLFLAAGLLITAIALFAKSRYR